MFTNIWKRTRVMVKRAWLNFTWFSMVVMRGEEGDRDFKRIYSKELVRLNI